MLTPTGRSWTRPVTYAARMHASLTEAGNRQAALSRFVEELDPAEAKLLRELLAETDRR